MDKKFDNSILIHDKDSVNRIEEAFPPIKNLYKNCTTNTILNVRNLKLSHQDQEQSKNDPPHHHSFSALHCESLLMQLDLKK